MKRILLLVAVVYGLQQLPVTFVRRSEEGLLPPWKESLSNTTAPLLYMPLYEHQLERLGELGARPVEVPENLALATNQAKKSRMGSRCFAVDGLFRRIRMTYFDGGSSIQVFNSLWYPNCPDAPLLGIDLLSFGAKKANRLLCVIDAQPVAGRDPHTQEVSHDTTELAAIHAAFSEKLGGVPTARWYEDNRYFSSQMLYGTTDTLGGPAGIQDTLLPAFQQYLDAYIHLISSSSLPLPTDSSSQQADSLHLNHLTLTRQAAYDDFNAARDPAHKLFCSYFGEAFANDFVHNFLFALSSSSDEIQGEGAESVE